MALAAERKEGGGTDGRPLAGTFITFEGVDGCGKSTQARLLAGRLRGLGHSVLETREPGGTEIGARLRAVLLDPAHEDMHPQCELLLYLADRVQHLAQTIRPALAAGQVVICDRYHDATVAYQHHARGLELASLDDYLRRHVHATPPDTTFWLDLPVDTARARSVARNRGDGDAALPESRLDNAAQAFYEKVRAGYAAIQAAEPERVLRVAAEGAEAAIHQAIWTMLEERYHGL